MTSSIRLGRIAGIEIGINWSWLVVFALIAWTYTRDFERRYDSLSQGEALALAVTGAALFFGSILAHELGHAFQARRDGMEIDGITLWLFGGVAKFRGMFPSAGAEFRIAIAGPLVSLVLGVVLLGIAMAADLPGPVDGLIGGLGLTNLLLLAFNLLPALPLDGGRVLRSALWGARGDFGWATRLAATIGRGFGFLFIAAGIALFITTGTVSGAWFAFIGWFLLIAASSEARYVAVRDALGGLRVRDLMVPDPVTVPADLPLDRFLDEVLWTGRHTTYPVVEDGRAVGLLPFRCVAEAPRGEWGSRRVRDCMLPLDRVPVVRPDEAVTEALFDLGEGDVGRALVLDGGRLAGLLTVTDVMRALQINQLRRRRGATRSPEAAPRG